MAQVDDMTHAVLLADEVAAGVWGALQALIGYHNISTHAAGKIDYHVNFALADALDDLAVMAGLHAEIARFRLPNMNVNDGRAGLCRGNGGGRNLVGRDGAVRALGHLGVIAGDGT